MKRKGSFVIKTNPKLFFGTIFRLAPVPASAASNGRLHEHFDVKYCEMRFPASVN